MIANIQRAVFDREDVSIGGGRFGREELLPLLRQAKTGEAIELACRDLPEGFVLQVSLERGAATVQLITATGISVDCDQEGLLAALEEGVSRAKSFLVPAGYTAEELERDNPFNAWLHDGDAPDERDE